MRRVAAAALVACECAVHAASAAEPPAQAVTAPAAPAAAKPPATAHTLDAYITQRVKAARGTGASVGFINLVQLNDAPDWVPVERTLTSFGVPPDRCACIHGAFETFVSEYNAVMGRDAPAYLDASQALADIDAVNDAARELSARELDRLATHATRFRARLEDTEMAFVRAAAECLAVTAPGASAPGGAAHALHPDWEHAVEALQLRARRRHWHDIPSQNRWVRLDMRALVERLHTLPTNPQPAATRHALLEHERTLTPMLRECGEAFWTIAPKVNRALADDDNAAGSPDLGARIRRIWAPYLQRAVALRNASKRAVQEVLLALPDDNRPAFHEAVQHAVYPELYPDHTCLLHAFDARIATQGAPAALDLTRLREAYAAEYAAQCTALEAFCDAWADDEAGGGAGSQQQKFPAALEPMLEQRTALEAKWKVILESAVPSAPPA